MASLAAAGREVALTRSPIAGSRRSRCSRQGAGPARPLLGALIAALCLTGGTDIHATTTQPRSAPTAEREAYYQYLIGKLSRLSGDLGSAAEHLQQAATVDDASAIRTELAETYLRMGDLGKAVEQARLATERDPTDPAARRALIEAYLAQAQRGPDRQASAALAIGELHRLVEMSPGDSDLRLTLGRLLLQEGNAEQAIVQFEGARSAGADPVQAGMLIARAQLGKGLLPAARAELQGVLALAPRHYEALVTLAQISEEQDDWGAAAEYYQRAVDVRPSDGEVRGRLGFALLKAGKPEPAILALREAKVVSPSDRRPRELLVRALRDAGRPGEALKEVEGLLEYRPGDPGLLVLAGRLHEERDENELALETYRRAAAASDNPPQGTDPLDENVRGGLTLAVAALETAGTNPRAAIRTLDKIPDDGSDLALDAGALRVRALAAAGDGAEAVKAALAFKERGPDDGRGPLLLLQARLAPGARMSVSAAIEEFHPEGRSPPELVGASDILRRAGAEKESVELLERATAAHPADATLLFSLGALHGQLGASRKAEGIMAKVLEIDPNQAHALNYLGYSLAERGKDLDRAESMIRKALEKDPDSGAYLDSLGWVLYKQGRLHEAEKELLRAADLLAGDPTVREHLGDIYARMGETAKALAEWRAALGFKPEDPARLKRKILEATRTPR